MSKTVRIGLMALAGALSLLASAPKPAAAITRCAFHAPCPVITCCCYQTTGAVACVTTAQQCSAFCH